MAAKADLATTLFPLGYALGRAFCNREQERKRLKNNLLEGTHTYITGRRRHGKTSLVRQTTIELSRKRTPKVHVETIDLMTVHTLDALEALLRKAVGDLMGQFLPRNKKVLGKLANVLDRFKPEITLTQESLSIRLLSDAPAAQSIVDLLTALDEGAKLYGRRAILVLDEFQQIAHIDKGQTIEGAIRSVAQGTKALTLVYLGSERTTLDQMFENNKRPLFNSGSERLHLGRIKTEDYTKYLQEAAELRWRKRLEEDVIERILWLTDRHPSYVNILCRDLWREKKPPTTESVNSQWSEVTDRERYQAQRELSAISQGQRTVLQGIATQPTDKPMAKEFLSRFGVAAGSVRQSLGVLMDKDFIRQTDQGVYEVVDPLVRSTLRIE